MGPVEYEWVDALQMRAADVSDTVGVQISQLMDRDAVARNLAFPRSQFPALKCSGYQGEHYEEMGRRLGSGNIWTLQTEEIPSMARYISYGASISILLLRPLAAETPLLAMSVILHELTHAIQDWKKWRLSPLDEEVDAHMAEALYMVRTNSYERADTETFFKEFLEAAEAFDGNAGYFRTRAYRKTREKFRQDIYQHYEMMRSTLTDNFDPIEFEKQFSKRRRRDGMDG